MQARGEGRAASGAQSVSAASVFLGRVVGGRRFDFSRFAVERIVEGQRASLASFGNRPEGGLKFDSWVRESKLRDLVGEVMLILVGDGRFVEEKDGAVWLRRGESAAEGQSGPGAGEEGEGEKDEWVIRRRTGQPTYFLADIAYHIDKRKRGFERVIDIWGPDHHGHVARMKTAMKIASLVMPGLAIGDDWLEILIAQQVNLVREGKRVQMSKRAGDYVTLDDLATEVGADAARFFFLMRRSNSHLDFDLDLAKKASEENPVYYIQYAHARICSIIEFARANGFTDLPPRADLSLLRADEEVDLIKALADFDDVVRASALSLEPHRLPTYLVDLAGRFHRFYHNHRVVTENREVSEARLCLSWAMRTILRSALALVGVSAPASM
jgi:arginyl-tRNA synthetase